jgi:glycosyltransferase involved in cell wall biosynthesis
MLSAIIATKESERTLVPTLSALVPAAASGLLAEVVVADASSKDATAEVADIAGCRYLSSAKPVGARLKEAAGEARSPWLLFLRAGMVPQPGWIDAADHFIRITSPLEGAARAAVFRPVMASDGLRPGLGEIAALFRSAFGGAPDPEQGLLIARGFYLAVEGHSAAADAERDLLRRLGRRRLAMLPVAISRVA